MDGRAVRATFAVEATPGPAGSGDSAGWVGSGGLLRIAVQHGAQVHPPPYAELAVRAGQVGFHGTQRQVQKLGDLGVRAAVGGQCGDPAFTGGQ